MPLERKAIVKAKEEIDLVGALTALDATTQSENVRFHRFERGFDEFVNGPGWKPVDIENFDAVQPPMVVHDILEHFPDGNNQVHWEFQAVGAAHWIRGKGGYYAALNTNITAGLAPVAFGMLFHHMTKHNLPTKPAPKELRDIPLDDTAMDITMQQTVLFGRDLLLKRYPAQYHRLIEFSMNQAMGWMRHGYRRAEKRYQFTTPQKVAALFTSLQNWVTNQLADLTVAQIALQVDVAANKHALVAVRQNELIPKGKLA